MKIFKIYNNEKKRITQASGSTTLYYIGKSPAQPNPPRKNKKWIRPQYPEGLENGVFLTSNWKEVAYYHGVIGNVYVYNVDNKVIKEAGELTRFDHATEILIPKNIWEKYIGDKIKLKGKMKEKKINSELKEYEKNIKRHDLKMDEQKKVLTLYKLDNSEIVTKGTKLYSNEEYLMEKYPYQEIKKIIIKEKYIKKINIEYVKEKLDYQEESYYKELDNYIYTIIYEINTDGYIKGIYFYPINKETVL